MLTFADIKPPSASLRGFIGETIKKEVWIIPRKDYPFTILSSRARYGRNIRFEIEEKKKWRGTRYLLTIENTKKDKGGYGDTVILRTDSDIKREIKIPVFGRILVNQ